jgi:hypothetical protein
VSTSHKFKVIVAREEGLPLEPTKGSTLKRKIPTGHKYDSKALKPLVRTLFSSSIALGHSVRAYREFTRIKSSSISPDGLIGGNGYVLSIKDVRSMLQQSSELLSSLIDTIHDEISAPHWKSEITNLEKKDRESINELLEKSNDIIDDTDYLIDNVKIPEKNVLWNKEEKEDIEDRASKIPGAGGSPIDYIKFKESNWKSSSSTCANSSIPVETLPGPRVNHLDRGEQTGPGGSYNRDEPRVEDNWGLTDGVVPKTLNKVWLGADALGVSGLPLDNTETEARDFGIGYGAKGRGSEGYGTKNPDGRGVWGPQSGLPDDPLTPIRDSGGIPLGPVSSTAESSLPFDGPDLVSRSDYYEGSKGNLVNVAESQMPGNDSINYDYNRDMTPNISIVHEQQSVPYVKRDWTTHNDRNDMQDLYRLVKNG